MEDVQVKDMLKGGEFLIKDTKAEDVFIPEEFNEEQMMVIDMVDEFVKTRILPNRNKIEKLDLELSKQLLEECGELGLLGTAIPEEYDGSFQDFLTNIRMTESLAMSGSFSLTHGAHTGIGTLPILYFGNADQKSKYLPPLVSGKLKAAYCLTEPGSGSDALAAKSKAILSEDGTHYVLNGQKMWITNGGIADVFVVFAQVDGDKFTGFIVEAAWEGVSTGAEEEKLGIKGSSTRQVFFENVKIPVENLLGDIGKGHKIAFNILNIGRIKLAAGVLGASKVISEMSIKYANERKQFKQSIANFGAIQHKLAEQAIKIYAVEAATYRASSDIQEKEDAMREEGKSLAESLLGAAEEFSIECAMMKVAATEVLDYVVDEGLQIYGGMGYSEEAPMASAYRDSRINRIFEGTNEINRMLSVDMLFRKALRGKLDIVSAAMAVQKELMSPPSFGTNGDNSLFAKEHSYIKNMKKAALVVAGATAQALMENLKEEQEILMNISDMLIELYVSESVLLRTEKLVAQKGEEACAEQIDMTRVYIVEALEHINYNGKRAIMSWADGDMLRTLMMGLKRFTKYEAFNTKNARRRIAKKLIEADKYCF